MSWSKESELKEQRPIYDPCLNGQAYENQGHWDKIISWEAFFFNTKLLVNEKFDLAPRIRKPILKLWSHNFYKLSNQFDKKKQANKTCIV